MKRSIIIAVACLAASYTAGAQTQDYNEQIRRNQEAVEEAAKAHQETEALNNKQIKLLEGEISRCQKEIDNLKPDLKRAQEKEKNLNTQLKLKKESARLNKKAGADAAAQKVDKDEVKRLELAHKQAKNDVKTIDARMDVWKKEISGYKKEINELKKSTREAKRELKESQKELDYSVRERQKAEMAAAKAAEEAAKTAPESK
ncbi:MAG: hypothetical protein IJU68_02945 [Bacteroidales bacterium]|nr:hypothetical protein [Bacteroidales bacterium]